MSGKVLIAAPVHQVLTDRLKAAGYELIICESITQQEAPTLLAPCTGVITSTRLMLNAALLDAAPKLRWIGRMGSGMEVIDVPYAEQKGIACYSSPEGNSNAVAEHALGLLLGITKRIEHSAAEVRQGQWLREENRGYELEGKTIGLIGFGHTGRAFARKLQGLDMTILAYDKYSIDNIPQYAVESSLERIWAEAHIVSFHVPIAADTYHYLNEDFMTKMRQPFVLLNTSRGVVVDAEVLTQGLASGRIVGAGLDVWEEEPIQKMSLHQRALMEQALSYPQVLITPHIAGYTHEALFKMSRVLVEKILHFTADR